MWGKKCFAYTHPLSQKYLETLPQRSFCTSFDYHQQSNVPGSVCIQFRLEEHSEWSALQCLDKFCTETEQQLNLYTFFHFDPILKCFMSHLISYNNQTLSASFDPSLLHMAPRYTSKCLSSNLVFHTQSVLLKVVILVRTGDFKRFMKANLNNIHRQYFECILHYIASDCKTILNYS